MSPAPATVANVALSFAAMEPVTYLTHRYVMHGFAMAWHRSHHGRREGRFERNDLFPVVFAGASIVGVTAALQIPRLAPILPVIAGVAAYGASYLFVHDIYIHRRLRRFTRTVRPLDRLAEAHSLHHRFGGEPYGMLLPIIPAELRERAARSSNGSRPFQVPSAR